MAGTGVRGNANVFCSVTDDWQDLPILYPARHVMQHHAG